MGDKSAIQWTDATWNPVTGCSKVSPGCAHCYAETLAKRLHRMGKEGYTGLPWTPANASQNVFLRPERLDQPLRWRRPRMIFVNSMSDLFHEEVPDYFIAQVFEVMEQAPQHTFQVLTKRPERMRQLLLAWSMDGGGYSPPANVWLGTSIENRRYVHRADLLRETPAAVRFISAEPLLGPLVHDTDVGMYNDCSHSVCDCPKRLGDPYTPCWSDAYEGPELDLTDIDWLIVGGESGPGHRRMDPWWVESLRDACETTAFFFKQWGGAT
ncbi:MAG TPA: phage Gp37/Gp68 family protein, partial [Solirubrobacteraceae bacterium]|nr:phage Gp37/Gp68 family protein [Solirubrobacteraceae bacterium]